MTFKFPICKINILTLVYNDNFKKKEKIKYNYKKLQNKELIPKEEAALLAYIALYYNCDKTDCWKIIGETIKRLDKRITTTVYRGHDKVSKRILNTTPFFSTSPLKSMAELFVEKKWSTDESKPAKRVGHLFTIHLINVPTINTREIDYNYSKKVFSELEKINNNRLIEKGSQSYTLKEYIPKIKSTIDNLVLTDAESNGEEILVLNGGTFYANKTYTKKGFKSLKNGDYETWYKYD